MGGRLSLVECHVSKWRDLIAMTYIVPRTCTELTLNLSDPKESKALADFRDESAYVLLGDPGSGKSTAFRKECADIGSGAVYVKARDFLTFEPSEQVEWHGRTIYIDGLDEVRSGVSNKRRPFDEIRRRLKELEEPAFRLSCRAADWLGAHDQSNLASVSRSGKVNVLNLDPLSASDIASILDAHPDVEDSRAFIGEALERGIEGFLSNPQILELLVANVVRGGIWPKSRRETFKGACLQMAREHNAEHQVVQQSWDAEKILDAAGRLCVVQLITDAAGYATIQPQEGENTIDPDECSKQDRNWMRLALSSKLFSTDSAGVAQPVHRQIAECTGAVHVARVIDAGLPVRRVISLMTGDDGLVATELRGLCGWLATISKSARATLIEFDPRGVGLYGDTDKFFIEDKIALLRSLAAQPLSSETAVYDGLAVSELSLTIRELLVESDRSQERQEFAVGIIGAVANGSPIEELSPIFIDIVRDSTWRIDVRNTALRAFTKSCVDVCEKTQLLTDLLVSLHTGKLEDRNYLLLGTLLRNLYPENLPLSDIWNYLHETGAPLHSITYLRFWATELLENSSGEQAAELLALLRGRMNEFRSIMDQHLNGLPLRLLAKALYACGDKMDVGDLYYWLQEGSDIWTIIGDEDDARETIKEWLEKHPDTLKAVFAEGLMLCRQSDWVQFTEDVSKVSRCLYSAEFPSDFGVWSLKQAVAIADDYPESANHLLEIAHSRYQTQTNPSEGLSIELLQSMTAENEGLKSKLDAVMTLRSPNEGLKSKLDAFMSSRPPNERVKFEIEVLPSLLPYKERERRTQERLERQRQEDAELLDYARAQKEALNENKASPELLWAIADRYLAKEPRIGGAKRLSELFRRDCELVDAALRALRCAIHRPDIPHFGDIPEGIGTFQNLPIALPILAGIVEREKATPGASLELGDCQLRTALTLYYQISETPDYLFGWHSRILAARPELLAEIIVKLTEKSFESGDFRVHHLSSLGYDDDYAEVARLASLPMLRAFQARSSTAPTKLLDRLLDIAFHHADRTAFVKLISEMLFLKSMNEEQRAHWLAAGLLTSPGKYIEIAEDFAKDSSFRTNHLVALFFQLELTDFPNDVRMASLLIRLVGSCSIPEDLLLRVNARAQIEESEVVWRSLHYLSSSPDKDAKLALETLEGEPALRNWSQEIHNALARQRVVRSDASYRHPNVQEVCRTLDGASPSNAGDLAALLVDRFDELALRIRTGNTDDWRQYWNEGSGGQSPTPKHEEHCRDALLSDLRQFLPGNVDAQPEGQYAGDRRVDIRVSHSKGFHVPVEVKRSSNANLWSAMNDQLIRHYSSDPETDGFGIYLVFWFGPNFTQKAHDGSRPVGPCDLKKALHATLSIEEARKVSVCVVDVSRKGQSN